MGKGDFTKLEGSFERGKWTFEKTLVERYDASKVERQVVEFVHRE
jgi:hypothetical protein